MSLAKYESEVKHVARPAADVYERYADLRNFEELKQRLSDPATSGIIAQHVPADKLEEVRKYIEGVAFDRDTITLTSPVGTITLRIVERDPKCIKFEGEGTPMPLYVWVQILPEGDAAAKLRVTVGAEINLFMKAMVAKPLQQAADGLANILVAAAQ